jgi:hypothetical protein
MMKFIKEPWPPAKQVHANAKSRVKYGKADKKPTWTSLICDALIQADDFMSVPILMVATKANFGQTTAALHHLAKCKAVESVIGGDGKLWWFATPSCDCRNRVVEERVPEEPGSRCRGRTCKTHSNKIENSCL